MEVKVNRRSARPKPPRMAPSKPVKKAKWDDKAKARIIQHFQRELNQSHGVKR